MGAFVFYPGPRRRCPSARLISLLALAEEKRVLAGEAGAALRELALTGARHKARGPRRWCNMTWPVGNQHPPRCGWQPWLVKFPPRASIRKSAPLSRCYAELARECGLETPRAAGLKCRQIGGVWRGAFDQEAGLRVPVHSLAGLLHIDFRLPGAADYTTFLRATRLLTRDEREGGKSHDRAVFNVLFHNRDDHPKIWLASWPRPTLALGASI